MIIPAVFFLGFSILFLIGIICKYFDEKLNEKEVNTSKFQELYILKNMLETLKYFKDREDRTGLCRCFRLALYDFNMNYGFTPNFGSVNDPDIEDFKFLINICYQLGADFDESYWWKESDMDIREKVLELAIKKRKKLKK